MTDPVRFSRLKYIDRSPAHYLHALTAAHDPTPSMRLGSLVHAVMAGEQPARTYARRGTKAYELELADIGQSAIHGSADEVDVAHAMATSAWNVIERHGIAVDGDILECPVHWRMMGRACAGTPDRYSRARGIVIDYKTCTSADPRKFTYDIRRYHYDAQLAWYANGLGMPEADCYIVAIENKPPYPTVVYRLTAAQRDVGVRKYSAWMETLLQCESANVWPGYSDAIVDVAPVEMDVDLDFGDE